MIVIVTENVPPRLRGYLSRWLVEVRAGVFVGSYSVSVRKLLWTKVEKEIQDGNAVLIWSANTESGFDFLTTGKNRRNPQDFEGLKLVTFLPPLEEQLPF